MHPVGEPQLRLVEEFVPPEGWYQCSECGRTCTEGSYGPRPLEPVTRRAGSPYCEDGELDEPGPWLCREHSRKVWGAYLRRRRRRIDIIRESALAGWPLTLSQYRARMAQKKKRGSS